MHVLVADLDEDRAAVGQQCDLMVAFRFLPPATIVCLSFIDLVADR